VPGQQLAEAQLTTFQRLPFGQPLGPGPFGPITAPSDPPTAEFPTVGSLSAGSTRPPGKAYTPPKVIALTRWTR
jgi:hypothetical protein